MTTISVARNGQEIGDYNLESVQEGLASGYFLSDDLGWHEGLSEWLPLNEVVSRLYVPSAPIAITPQLASPPSPASVLRTPPRIAKTQKIKQNLKPKKGEVTYVLKEAKAKRKKNKSGLSNARMGRRSRN